MLPRINKPTFQVKIPSTGKFTAFHMMSRRDEKVLLIAKTSNETADWLNAIKQVVNACAAEPIDTDKIASFDLEYIFLRLRALSIGSQEKLTYHDNADDKEYTVDVDLENINVTFPEGANPQIKINEATTLEMRWPPAQTWSDMAILKADNPEAAFDSLIASCVEKIWVDNQVFETGQLSQDELVAFLDSLDIKIWDEIRTFISKTPHLSHWVEWTNSKGDQRRFELTTLADFFPLGNVGP